MELFREVNRLLKSGAGFHVIYSDRMFPTKAVAVWTALDDAGRSELISAYFRHAGGWEPAQMLDLSPQVGYPTDPVSVVMARKSGR